MSKFKEQHPYEERVKESERIRKKYPNRIPIICEKDPRSQSKDIDKNKFLVPRDLTVSQFAYVIRKRLKVTPETAIFILADGNFINGSELMEEVYEKYKEDCGYVFLTFSNESVFGV